MQFTSQLNKGSQFLFCVIDIYRKYACIVSFKHKKCITMINIVSVTYMV